MEKAFFKFCPLKIFVHKCDQNIKVDKNNVCDFDLIYKTVFAKFTFICLNPFSFLFM